MGSVLGLMMCLLVVVMLLFYRKRKESMQFKIPLEKMTRASAKKKGQLLKNQNGSSTNSLDGPASTVSTIY